MLLLLSILLQAVVADMVLDVQSSQSGVSQTSIISATISLTSSTSKVQFSLPTEFSIRTTGCKVNNSAASCSVSTLSSTIFIAFSGTFTGTQKFEFEVTNPVYEFDFDLYSYNQNTRIGGGSTIISTKAYQSTCSLTQSSNVVGTLTYGQFQISTLAIPSDSLIFVAFPKQSTFRDIITNPSSVTCQSSTGSVSCILLSSGLDSYTIQVNGVFQNNNASGTVRFNMSNMNTPPFNDTFSTIDIQVTTADSYKIEYCSVKQPAPTILRTSSIIYDGWQSPINQQSTIAMRVIPRSTIPTPFQIVIAYPLSLSLTPLLPALYQLTATNSSNQLTLTNLTLSSGQISFSLFAINPSSVRSLPISVYISYSSSQFMESADITNMTLTIAQLALNVSVSNILVMAQSTLRIDTEFKDPVSGYISVSVSSGTINCSVAPKINDTLTTTKSCNSTSVTFSANVSAIRFISFPFTNPLSTQPVTVILKTFSQSDEPISQGSSSIVFNATTLPVSLTTSQLKLGQLTNISLVESSAFITNQRRIFTINAPSNLNFSGYSISGSSINSYSLSSSSLTVDINGILNITIRNIRNPVLYNGTKEWTISCKDTNAYNIASGTISPSEYTAASAYLTVSLANLTIEEQTQMTINLIESLSHYSNDYIIINTVDVVTPCTNCEVLSSTTIKIPYSSKMQLKITVKNPYAPNVYDTTASYYTSSGILTEESSINFTIIPMKYQFAHSFSGFMGQDGFLEINATKYPTTVLSLSYSTAEIFESAVCRNCNHTNLNLTGNVKFFTTSTINIKGMVGSVVYAQGNLTVSYPCAVGCHICNSTSCIQCFGSEYTNLTYYYNGSCLSTCPVSTYAALTNCIDCQNNCYKCNSTTCQQCKAGFYLFNRTCVSQCPEGYVVTDNGCQVKPLVCPDNCLKCNVSQKCITCQSGYLLYQNLCYESCPDGMMAQDGGCVVAPIPPQESLYFPFSFLVAAGCLFIILAFFKLFDKRSLILGNFISGCIFLEIGSMLMFVTYCLLDNSDILNQALAYAILLSKVSCNLFMLIYFVKKLSVDQTYNKWLEEGKSHESMKTAAMILGTLISFQFYRILYSRLLGLHMFFARFGSPQILKPMKYLNISYFIVTSGCLIAMAAISLFRQHTVKTSLFYSSIEIITLQVILFIFCIIDDCRKGQEHFDYQIYKIDNEFQAPCVPIPAQHSLSEIGGITQSISINNLDGDRISDSQYIIEKKDRNLVDRLDGQEGYSSQTKLKNIFEQEEDKSQDGKSQLSRKSKKTSKSHMSNRSHLSKKSRGSQRQSQMSQTTKKSQLIRQSRTPKRSDDEDIVEHESDAQQAQMEQIRLEEGVLQNLQEDLQQQLALKQSLAKSQDELSKKYSQKSLFRRKALDEWNQLKYMQKQAKLTKNKSMSPIRSGVAQPPRSVSTDKIHRNHSCIPSCLTKNIDENGKQKSEVRRDLRNKERQPRGATVQYASKDEDLEESMSQKMSKLLDGKPQEAIRLGEQECLNQQQLMNQPKTESNNEMTYDMMEAQAEEPTDNNPYETPRIGEWGNNSQEELPVTDRDRELEMPPEEKRRKRKKPKASRYKNTAVEEIYLQRLTTSVSKPTKKPNIDKLF